MLTNMPAKCARLIVLAGLALSQAGCSDSANGGWAPAGEEQVYNGEELFDYINGGADIYLEYGFREVRVREYARGGKTVTVEVFEMDDADAAFGIYSFKRGTGGERVDAGQEGVLNDYYLNFWRGRLHVTLTGFDGEKDTREGLKTLAREVDAVLGAAAGSDVARPRLVQVLPAEGMVPDSARYLAGRLGLANSAPFLGEIKLGIAEAALADYGGGLRLCILGFADAARCSTALSALRGHFADQPGCVCTEEENSFLAKESDRDYTRVTPHRNRIIVVFGKWNPADIDALAARAAAGLR
jgi:hypothetical protein